MSDPNERLSDVLARAYTPPSDASRPTDARVQEWIQDAQTWREKRDYQRQLDAAGLDGYSFMQRHCETRHNDNMRPENIMPLLTDYLALLNIVEALAASDPLECDAARTELWYCPLCSGESALDSDAFRHADDCAYARAVALAGPTGEREEGK